MKCEEFMRQLDNYECLTDAQKAEMNEHTLICERCREELDFYLSIVAEARNLPPIDVPPDFLDKLNEKLDMEDTAKKTGIAYYAKRYWKQYAACAAGLALVAAVAAGSTMFMNRMNEVVDGTKREETVANNKSNSNGDAAASSAVPAKESGSAADNPQTDSTKQELPKEISDIIASPSSVASAGNRRTSQTTNTQSSSVFNRITNNRDYSVSEAAGNNDEASNSDLSANATTETAEQPSFGQRIIPEKNGDDYGIALAGVIDIMTNKEEKMYDIRPEDVSSALRASEIKEKYSLAENSENIAFGQYYIIDENGNPVEDEAEVPAIGAIKVSSTDKEKAEQVISQYPHDENGSVYTTNSENLSNILSDLSEEGVEYTDYTLAGSGDVKFRIDY
jgi:hypothetical protein